MRARPRVDITVPLEQTVVLGRFRDRLGEPDAPCQGHVGRGELSLMFLRCRSDGASRG